MQAAWQRVVAVAGGTVAAMLCSAAVLAEEPRGGTVEGRHAVAQVSMEQYIRVHSDLLYTHDGDNRAEGPEHNLARDNIHALFAQYGLQASIEPFDYWGYAGFNVVGQLTGTTRPNDIYIVGAHYDSITLDYVGGPGADDNATGVAAVLEMARLLAQWPSEATIRFIAFDLEEWGLIGSEAYVEAHLADNIRGMLSLDMLAFRLDEHNQALVGGRSQSEDVKSALIAALGDYAGIAATDVGEADYSDHAPFEWWGFHAAVLDEYDLWENPNYHTQQDSVDTWNYINYAYATTLTRGVLGWLVDAAGVTPRHPAGDMDCDATVGTADINAFVLALVNAAAYAAAYPDCHLLNADCNCDGQVDFGDINPFMAQFYGPCQGPQGVGEWWTAEAPADYVGTSVSVSGSFAAVGSNAEDIGSLSGSVLVFEQTAGVWGPVARLTSPSGSADDYFGRSVAVAGNTVLVGATGDSEVAPYAGAAYVFELVGDTWTPTGKLMAADGAPDDGLGRAVAISGDTAVVGAPGVDGLGLDIGAAYVFERDGGVWTQVAELTASDGTDYDAFGFSVALSGDRAVVGAIAHNGARGAAYVFERSAGAWTQVAELMAADGLPDDRFGYAVGISGDQVVVGAHRQRSAAYGRSLAYVFESQMGSWTQAAKLGTWGSTSRVAVAIDGDTALVGRDHGNLPSNSGAVHIFRLLNGAWTETGQLTPWDGGPGESFGNAVALCESAAVVGAMFHTAPTGAPGAAYVFDLNGDGIPRIVQPPADQSVSSGAAATFAVNATGPCELSYRWRKDGHRLSDDGHISGATAPVLTINPVDPEDAGAYDVVIRSLCGSVTSGPATLDVTMPAAAQ